jgi:glycine/D-amino acid oxidase-like deaminating enzyme
VPSVCAPGMPASVTPVTVLDRTRYAEGRHPITRSGIMSGRDGGPAAPGPLIAAARRPGRVAGREACGVTLPDVVVVGAGVLGAAIAYESARRGLRVVVVEREAGPAAGATRWSMAGLIWLAAADDHLRRLSWEGLARHRTLGAELGADTGFRPLPMLLLAESGADLARLDPLLEAGNRAGFRGERVGPDDLLRLEPALAPGVAVGGVRCEQGHVDPVRLTEAWLAAAERLGATLRYGSEVGALDLGGGRGAAVETGTGRLAGGRVVVAAGAWSRGLLARAGIEVPVLHSHAEILETPPRPPVLTHFVAEASGARAALEEALASPAFGPRWAGDATGPTDSTDANELLPAAIELGAVQLSGGRVRLGQVSRAVPGFLPGPLAGGEALIRERIKRFFPRLAAEPATLRGRPVAISADRLPVAGPLPQAPDVYVVAGMDSPLISAPAIGARVAGALAGDAVPDLAPFRPDRFATGLG